MLLVFVCLLGGAVVGFVWGFIVGGFAAVVFFLLFNTGFAFQNQQTIIICLVVNHILCIFLCLLQVPSKIQKESGKH